MQETGPTTFIGMDVWLLYQASGEFLGPGSELRIPRIAFSKGDQSNNVERHHE